MKNDQNTFLLLFLHNLKVQNLYYYYLFLDKRKVYLVKRMVQMFYFNWIDCLYLLFIFMFERRLSCSIRLHLLIKNRIKVVIL